MEGRGGEGGNDILSRSFLTTLTTGARWTAGLGTAAAAALRLELFKAGLSDLFQESKF